MIRQLERPGRQHTRRHMAAIVFAAAVVVGIQTPAFAASSDGYWGQLISRNSEPRYLKCLTTQGDAGLSVYQDYCSNDSWKLWHLKPVGGGYYNVISDWDGHCLDVYAFNHDNYGLVTTWRCNGYTNQQWSLGLSSKGFTLKPRHARYDNDGAGKCLDVFAFAHNDGAPVVQWDCNGAMNQFWAYDGVWES
jgi:hypothetical protein